MLLADVCSGSAAQLQQCQGDLTQPLRWYMSNRSYRKHVLQRMHVARSPSGQALPPAWRQKAFTQPQAGEEAHAEAPLELRSLVICFTEPGHRADVWVPFHFQALASEEKLESG